MDFGRCVEFTGGFSIWEKPYALKMMCLGSEDNSKQSNGENTTDTPGFESMWLLVALSVIFVINRRHK